MSYLQPARQRKFATYVVQELRRHKYESYFAGGCVRDQLLDRVPVDYDVATDATPDQIRQVFDSHRTLSIGVAFGVITVLGPQPAGQVQVATFRKDVGYRDGRRPESISFANAEEDAKRRDFTINGLFYEPGQGRVIDFVGGQNDLERQLVRAIGNPLERFREDKLRLLRAVRFSATYAFRLEEKTFAAVLKMAPQIEVVSAERIGFELRRMLTHQRRAAAVRLLEKTGLLIKVLPELALLATDTSDHLPWRQTLDTLAALTAPSFSLAVAALLHRAGNEELVESVGKRWRLSNKEIKRAAWLVKSQPKILRATTLSWPELQRLLVTPGIDELLELHTAVTSETCAELSHCRNRLALPPQELNPQPIVTGNDLVTHGVPPGRPLGQLLHRIRNAQLEKQIGTREEALRFVDHWLAQGLDENATNKDDG